MGIPVLMPLHAHNLDVQIGLPSKNMFDGDISKQIRELLLHNYEKLIKFLKLTLMSNAFNEPSPYPVEHQ